MRVQSSSPSTSAPQTHCNGPLWSVRSDITPFHGGKTVAVFWRHWLDNLVLQWSDLISNSINKSTLAWWRKYLLLWAMFWGKKVERKKWLNDSYANSHYSCYEWDSLDPQAETDVPTIAVKTMKTNKNSLDGLGKSFTKEQTKNATFSRLNYKEP